MLLIIQDALRLKRELHSFWNLYLQVHFATKIKAQTGIRFSKTIATFVSVLSGVDCTPLEVSSHSLPG